MAAVPKTLDELRSTQSAREAQLPQVRAGFSDLAGFELAQRAAKALAASSLVPQNYQGNLADCIVALELAQRIGASPLMVMQNLYIVHGRPAWSSQFLIAAVNQCGRYTALQYEWTGERGRDDWTCRAYARDKATGERVQGPSVSIAMAKKEGWYDKKGSKWQTIPELMLMYRAATFFARTNAPELTMGLSAADEIHDVYDAAQEPGGTFTVAEMKEGATVVDQPQAAPQEPEPEPAQPERAAQVTLAAVLDMIERTHDEEIATQALDLARDLSKAERAKAVAAFNAKFATTVG